MDPTGPRHRRGRGWRRWCITTSRPGGNGQKGGMMMSKRWGTLGEPPQKVIILKLFGVIAGGFGTNDR